MSVPLKQIREADSLEELEQLVVEASRDAGVEHRPDVSYAVLALRLARSSPRLADILRAAEMRYFELEE